MGSGAIFAMASKDQNLIVTVDGLHKEESTLDRARALMDEAERAARKK